MLLNGIYIPSFVEEEDVIVIGDSPVDTVRASSTSGDDVKEARSKRRRLNWLYEGVYYHKEDAMHAFEAEDSWTFGYDNFSSSGKKITYRCNKVTHCHSLCFCS